MLNGDEKLNVDLLKKELKPIFDSFGVKKAVLFGSIAKGTNTKSSDVDLIVDSGLKGFKFISLASAIKECVYRNVDIFDTTHIIKGSKIEKEIADTGILIYG